MKNVAHAHPDRRLELWFQDEARFGRQGTLTRVWAERGSHPRALRPIGYEWVYLFGAVCPASGATHAVLFPCADVEVMEAYLADFARHLSPGVHALLVLDRAGWHTSGKLHVPARVTLQFLPPKSPESNPAELPWREMRQKHLSNRVFPTVAYMDDEVAEAWRLVTQDEAAVRSLCDFDWIPIIGKN